MGNICRSPLAAGITWALFEQAGLSGKVFVDSAGTVGSHAGEAADPRSRQVARARGYSVDRHVARKIKFQDFEEFDLILAMDQENLRYLKAKAPQSCRAQVGLMLAYAGLGVEAEVPDPYYSNLAGFEHVLDLCECAGKALLAAYQEGRLLSPWEI